MVLGNEINAYNEARLATPYLNWGLAQLHFNNPEYYDNLDMIYQNFSNDPPEVIIDTSQTMEVIFEYLPLLESKYRKKEKDVYELISN